MNNKSKIYIAAHKDTFSNLLSDANAFRSEGSLSIGEILLEITHLYLGIVKDADESEYWATFAFDTCSAAGVCSERYISHLNPNQKREYILKTFEARSQKSKEKQFSPEALIGSICKFIASNKDNQSLAEANERKIANAILDYIHILISIDRKIENTERSFFAAIRDGVYKQMGWQSKRVDFLESDDKFDSQANEQTGTKKASKNETIDEIISDVEKLIGLDNIKDEIKSVVNSLQVQRLRVSAGLPNAEISNHMVFYGNPGTGKTTIARKLGEVYRYLGVLSKGHFVETDRSGLVGGYLGQTAIKTAEVLESALGGILFIDEAYSLSSKDGNDQYGQEAIDTLLKYMEDHRDDLIVIVAGYEKPMGLFIQSNSGLKSRFNKYFYFNDYSEDELFKIFVLTAEQGNYFLDSDAEQHLRQIIGEIIKRKAENFGNGRTIRNLFEKSIQNQANRIMRQSMSGKSELMRLTSDDILWEDMIEIAR